MSTHDRQRHLLDRRMLAAAGVRLSITQIVSLVLVLVLITSGGAG